MTLGDYAVLMAKANLTLTTEFKLNEYAIQIGKANLELATELALAEEEVDELKGEIETQEERITELGRERDEQHLNQAQMAQMPLQWRSQVAEAQNNAIGLETALRGLSDVVLKLIHERELTADDEPELYEVMEDLAAKHLIASPFEEPAHAPSAGKAA